MFDQKKTITFALVGLGLGLLGAQNACSSGSSCTYTKACPNDPEPTAEQKKAFEDACKNQETNLAGQPCYNEAKAVGDCSKGAIVCTNGVTDQAATAMKIQSSCLQQSLNAATCCQSNPTSKVCM